jgi:hypothetical protein
MMDIKLQAATLAVAFGLLGIAGVGSVAQAGPLAGLAAQTGQSDSSLWTEAQARRRVTPARPRAPSPRQPQQPAPQPGGGSGFIPG